MHNLLSGDILVARNLRLHIWGLRCVPCAVICSRDAPNTRVSILVPTSQTDRQAQTLGAGSRIQLQAVCTKACVPCDCVTHSPLGWSPSLTQSDASASQGNQSGDKMVELSHWVSQTSAWTSDLLRGGLVFWHSWNSLGRSDCLSGHRGGHSEVSSVWRLLLSVLNFVLALHGHTGLRCCWRHRNFLSLSGTRPFSGTGPDPRGNPSHMHII